MYKERNDEHFYIGPPWDFDAWTFGLYDGPRKLYATTWTLYYRQLFTDPVFINRVKEKWLDIYPRWKSEIPIYIDERYEYIRKSAIRNESLLWNNWHRVNEYPQKEYRQVVEDMKNNYLIQLDWMNEQFSLSVFE